jgi:organic hydroperoxide reductase OsmC/OhrA
MNNATGEADSTAPVEAVYLVLRDDYSFDVSFRSEVPSHLLTDASPPLGKGAGPDSEMLLAAAVANCLSASLAFALRKFKNEVVSLSSTASVSLGRNIEGRLRVRRLAVEIRLGAAGSAYRLLERALAQYEDFCVVTQAIRAAIPVDVKVVDGEGKVLTCPPWS